MLLEEYKDKEDKMPKYFPLMINLHDKKITVIGGGYEALKIVEKIYEYGPLITVLSEGFCEELYKLALQAKNIRLVEAYYGPNEFDAEDLNNSFLVIAASDSFKLNKLVYEKAKEKKIFVNNVNAHEISDFILPSKIDRGDLTVAISTNEKNPILAKKIRQDLESEFGSHYAQFLELMSKITEKTLKNIDDKSIRDNLLEKLVYSNILDLIKQGKMLEAKEKANHIINAYADQ